MHRPAGLPGCPVPEAIRLLGLAGILALQGCGGGVVPPVAGDIAFVDAAIVDVASGRVEQGRVIVVRDGRIEAVLDQDEAGRISAPRIVDLSGAHVLPGLWDAHVHVAGNPAEAERIAAGMISSGVLYLRDLAVSLDNLGPFRERWRELSRRMPVPDIILSGPVLDDHPLPWYRDLQFEIHDPAEAERVVAELEGAGVDHLKVYSGLRPDVYEAILGAAHARALPVDGHVPTAVGLQGVANGSQRTIEHLDIFTLLSCAEEGAVWQQRGIEARFGEGYGAYFQVMARFWDALDWSCFDRAARALGRRGAGWTPTLVMEALSEGTISRISLTRLSSSARDWCDAQLMGVSQAPSALRTAAMDGLKEALSRLQDAGVTLLAGTDLPNHCGAPGSGIHDELELLVAFGLTPRAALATATLNPARLFAKEASAGVVESAPASFIVIQHNPLDDVQALRTVHGVMLRGEWLDGGRISALEAMARGEG
jgi:imidazolonepropionase-like amidohydrolase